MSATKTVSRKDLGALADAFAAAGQRVIAPVRDAGKVRFRAWAPGAELCVDEVPGNSLKDALFPPSEVIGRCALKGDSFAPIEHAAEPAKTVVFCARPCDAAALSALDSLFAWGSPDAFYEARRAATTMLVLVCSSADEHCFCTSVGGSPDSAEGADALLRPAGGGKELIFEARSPKGEALASAAGALLKESSASPDPVPAVPKRFDPKAVGAWLGGNFDSPLWAEASLPCLGCGACAYACPACHCFDIQDEATRGQSVRYRNWDSCGFGLFTQHAGGHNPRAEQSARWRQRVMHKFSYFPERLGRLSCTGCGRCARLCPGGMSMAEFCAALPAPAEKP